MILLPKKGIQKVDIDLDNIFWKLKEKFFFLSPDSWSFLKRGKKSLGVCLENSEKQKFQLILHFNIDKTRVNVNLFLAIGKHVDVDHFWNFPPEF